MSNQPSLSDPEISAFIRDLDRNNDGFIEYKELEEKLDAVHKVIAPEPKPHHLHHEDRDDEARHRFLRSLIDTEQNKIPNGVFKYIVRNWNIPSLSVDEKAEKNHDKYMNSIPIGRRIKAYWSVEGPEIVFITIVVSLHLAFGIWQMVKYIITPPYREAFGWGVVLAKTCAGALYPSLFFLILSMSRHLSTLARRSERLTRYINFDVSQSFHVKMSIVTLCLGTLHGIGHLTGSFVFGSSKSRQDSVALVFGPDGVPRPYRLYVASLPGATGITALGLFWLLAAMSMPKFRSWSYEVFQLGHLLMFPIIGLLMAHGTAAILQFPMLGYWLALPTLLVIMERLTRFANGFRKIPARLVVLDPETVCITMQIPRRRFKYWPGRYRAGQYILLQVPQVSFFQWHPFTISCCTDNEFQVHVKTDGNWTEQLRELTKEGKGELKYVGVDGPFGAPAQRFERFDTSIIIGSGIGVTPFSGILADLHEKEKLRHPDSLARDLEAGNANANGPTLTLSKSVSDVESSKKRVDFHWMVRDKNNLLWFSHLLNSLTYHQPVLHRKLDIRLHTHVTQRRKDISQHIFRCLLEKHRTDEHPASPLTGLLNETQFGRPDMGEIMETHYQSMLEEEEHSNSNIDNVGNRPESTKEDRKKVGVFFCGAPPIGAELADRCQMLTARSRNEKTNIEYHFMMEVFG